MSKVYNICNSVDSACGIAFGGGGSSDDNSSETYSSASADCYLSSTSAVLSTAAAVVAPNPLTIGNAAVQWGSAINECTNK